MSAKNCLGIILLPALLLGGCSIEEEIKVPEDVAALENVDVLGPDPAPSNRISLNRELAISGSEGLVIGSIAGVTADDDGRIYIADSDKSGIHVFDENGKHITTVGRRGKGPGEFGQIKNARVQNGKLYALDLSLNRIHRFSIPDWQHEKTVMLFDERPAIGELRHTQPDSYNLRSDGTLIVGFAENFSPMTLGNPLGIYFYAMNDEGKIISDRIARVQSPPFLGSLGSGLFPSPFGSRAMVAFAPDGSVYTADSDRFLIKVRDEEGTYQRAVYVARPNAPLDKDALVESYSGNRRQIIRNADIPDTWQALGRLHADDEGRVWAAAITENRDEYEWWVLEVPGGLIARFTWPREKDIKHIKNGSLYTLETNPETGGQTVVRYGIELNGE